MTGLRAVVIIPHRDDPQRLAKCLDALCSTCPSDVGVVVVDNGSTMAVDDIVARHENATLLLEARPGAAHARNTGVAGTDAPVLLFTDADCVAASDWVERALVVIEGRDAVGGAVAVFHETPGPLSGAQAFEAAFAFQTHRYITRERYAVTANLVVRRAVFEAVGPFRPDVAEDRDWGLRAHAAGFEMTYDPALCVAHPSRPDWAALRRKWRRVTDEGFALHLDRGGSRVYWAGRAMLLPFSIPVHAPRLLRHPDLSASEKLGGLATLARLRLLRMGWMLRQVST